MHWSSYVHYTKWEINDLYKLETKSSYDQYQRSHIILFLWYKTDIIYPKWKIKPKVLCLNEISEISSRNDLPCALKRK